MTNARRPRAVGRRRAFDTVPPQLRAWVEHELGSHVIGATTQVGGMSPGPAARLVLEDGTRAFIKAVSGDPNPQTPALFRHEVAVLGRLPAVSYRPAVLATYDDGEWVALLLDDVEGRHPDLDVSRELDAVREVVRDQSLTLTASDIGVATEDVPGRIFRWHRSISLAEDSMRVGLPEWWVREELSVMARIASLAERVGNEAWCHFDVRDDNLLVRADGRAVVLDWGMSCAGPSWVDEVLLDLHSVATPEFDRLVEARPAYDDSGDLETDVTDFLLALGSSLAVAAQGPAPQGLPWISDFRRTEARRILEGARRRLGL